MAYLSTAAYIARFGDRETALLTNTTAVASGSPATVDTAKVQTALDDATEIVNAYVGRRYIVPIESPPNIVTGWVAALAREALHVNTGRTNQTVTDAADRVRAQLKDLTASPPKLDLPIPVGETSIPASSQGLPESSNDRPCPTFAGNHRLDELTAPFTGGGYAGAWRGGRY